jgi:hypothetical protein
MRRQGYWHQSGIPPARSTHLVVAEMLAKGILAIPYAVNPAAAESQMSVQQMADTMDRLCVGGGRTQAVTTTVTGGAEISLRDVKGIPSMAARMTRAQCSTKPDQIVGWSRSAGQFRPKADLTRQRDPSGELRD